MRGTKVEKLRDSEDEGGPCHVRFGANMFAKPRAALSTFAYNLLAHTQCRINGSLTTMTVSSEEYAYVVAVLISADTADTGAYTYGLGHPMKPQRMRITHELVSAYGMLDKMHVLVSSVYAPSISY